MKTLARIALGFALLLGGVARAQYADPTFSMGTYRPGQTLWILNWEIAGGVGDFGSYVGDTSLRGFSFEGRSFLRENISLGLSFSWNRFYQTKDLAQMSIPNGAISGPLYNYADMFGIRAIGHYYFMQGPLQPYFGVGIGGVWDYAYQQVADLTQTYSHFDFIMSPEVGLFYTVAKGGTSAGLNVAPRYTFTTAKFANVENAQTLSGIVGVNFGY